jgi:homoserine O-acetyltransferase/O-succinyltransferase
VAFGGNMQEVAVPFAGSALELPPHEVIGATDSPVVIALGGISADRHVRSWWSDVTGAGRALDTDRYRLVGVDFLDAGTTHDQADAVAAVLDELEVSRAHGFVGASYGGMVALAFAEKYPERLERLIVFGAAHRPHAMTTALRVIQRRIVELGWETGRARDALVLARALAVTTYRSPQEFAQRFATPEDVEQYLVHQGEKFAERFSPARFLALSLSADLHRVDPSRITARTTLVAAEGDMNVPREQLEELSRLLGGPSRLVDLPSSKGHDAFLTEPHTVSRILTEALES